MMILKKKSWKSKLYCLKIQYFKSSSNIMKDDGGEFYDGGTPASFFKGLGGLGTVTFCSKWVYKMLTFFHHLSVLYCFCIEKNYYTRVIKQLCTLHLVLLKSSAQVLFKISFSRHFGVRTSHTPNSNTDFSWMTAV